MKYVHSLPCMCCFQHHTNNLANLVFLALLCNKPIASYVHNVHIIATCIHLTSKTISYQNPYFT